MTHSAIQDSEREEIARFVERHWFSRGVIVQGQCYYPHREQGFVERREGQIVGLLTYHIGGDQMHVLTLNSTVEGVGIGTSLMLQAIETARQQRCRRLWLTTTNDNLRALGFYQRIGFRMVAVNVGAIDEARKLKPELPETGQRGIPIHDEIVLELRIKPYLEPGPGT